MRSLSSRALLALALVMAAATARPAAADLESAKRLFLEKVKSTDWKERRLAYGTLPDHDGGPAARLILDHILEEKNAVVYATGLEALAGFRSVGARQALIEALRKGKAPEKPLAAYALAGHVAPEADEALLEALATGA